MGNFEDNDFAKLYKIVNGRGTDIPVEETSNSLDENSSNENSSEKPNNKKMKRFLAVAAAVLVLITAGDKINAHKAHIVEQKIASVTVSLKNEGISEDVITDILKFNFNEKIEDPREFLNKSYGDDEKKVYNIISEYYEHLIEEEIRIALKGKGEKIEANDSIKFECYDSFDREGIDSSLPHWRIPVEVKISDGKFENVSSKLENNVKKHIKKFYEYQDSIDKYENGKKDPKDEFGVRSGKKLIKGTKDMFNEICELEKKLYGKNDKGEEMMQ